MKLVTKFALWYLGITTLVLLVGGVFVFRSVQHENDEEEVRRLRGLMEDVVAKIGNNIPLDDLQSDRISVAVLPPGAETIPFQAKDTMSWHSRFQGDERQIVATQSHMINGKHYAISARSFAPEPEETITGVIRSLSWIFLVLMLIVALTSILVSRKILSPFNASLRAMETFNLKQKGTVKLPATKTKEFRALNDFLGKMTSKALDDYRSLKEFTENASHELQTPLAIIRGKLELLLESDITDGQAKMIMSAYEAVERLSKTNHALALLTKLENREFQAGQPVDFTSRLHNILYSFSELIDMKAITLKTDIRDPVNVAVHPELADILLMNLLSNAIRHNHPQGIIEIELTADHLLLRNTGDAPEVSTEQLFQRFRKGNQSSDSIGLGLSIVKRICEVSRFSIDYRFSKPWHTVNIFFASPLISR